LICFIIFPRIIVVFFILPVRIDVRGVCQVDAFFYAVASSALIDKSLLIVVWEFGGTKYWSMPIEYLHC
jgi:hypothetical protein